MSHRSGRVEYPLVTPEARLTPNPASMRLQVNARFFGRSWPTYCTDISGNCPQGRISMTGHVRLSI
jgi:hypothetical protein